MRQVRVKGRRKRINIRFETGEAHNTPIAASLSASGQEYNIDRVNDLSPSAQPRSLSSSTAVGDWDFCDVFLFPSGLFAFIEWGGGRGGGCVYVCV
jgi:hypothetical protein